MEIGDISIDAGPSDTIVGGEPAIIDDLIAAEPLTNDPIIGDDLDNLSSEPSVEGVPVKTSAPSPGLQASVHSGIAALNRAMVNMSLMMDPAKVLNRLAGAASQAGIQSGAVSVLQGEALKFGIMWSRESDRSQVKEGIPGSANGKILAAMAPSLAAEDQWFDIKSTFGNNYDAFKNSWIDQAHVPDSVMVRKRGDSYVVAFASFAGGANHDGLKQTFGEVVKAVSSRLG